MTGTKATLSDINFYIHQNKTKEQKSYQLIEIVFLVIYLKSTILMTIWNFNLKANYKLWNTKFEIYFNYTLFLPERGPQHRIPQCWKYLPKHQNVSKLWKPNLASPHLISPHLTSPPYPNLTLTTPQYVLSSSNTSEDPIGNSTFDQVFRQCGFWSLGKSIPTPSLPWSFLVKLFECRIE